MKPPLMPVPAASGRAWKAATAAPVHNLAAVDRNPESISELTPRARIATLMPRSGAYLRNVGLILVAACLCESFASTPR